MVKILKDGVIWKLRSVCIFSPNEGHGQLGALVVEKLATRYVTVVLLLYYTVEYQSVKITTIENSANREVA